VAAAVAERKAAFANLETAQQAVNYTATQAEKQLSALQQELDETKDAFEMLQRLFAAVNKRRK
jgi:TolA-binding protein